MNIPQLTFLNSPIYTGALLALLILIATLKKPTKSLLKILKKSYKTYKTKKAKKQEIKLEKLKQEPVIKTVVKTKKILKKIWRQDWTTGLFTIIGSGIIINALVKNWSFLTSNYTILEELVMGATGHKNLATIIITIVFAGILILIADIFEIFQRSKSIFMKIFTILFFGALTAGTLIALTQINLSLINTIIMGTVFIISGFLFNLKRIFPRENKASKEKEEVIIKEDSLNKIKEASQY